MAEPIAQVVMAPDTIRARLSINADMNSLLSVTPQQTKPFRLRMGRVQSLFKTSLT